MKKLFLIFTLAAGITVSALAQQQFKFGHINSRELLMLMPERDSAQLKTENYAKELQEQLEIGRVELNNRIKIYQEKQATWSAAILESKQKEIQDMSSNLQEFQQKAQEEFAQMQQILMAPVIEKANNAINKVGKEQGFIYIFDISIGAVPYFSTEQSTDVLPMVKAELKIPVDKKIPVQTTKN